jgi:oligoendopeptidase F
MDHGVAATSGVREVHPLSWCRGARTRAVFTALLATMLISDAPAQTDADRWNLGDLYANDAAWSADAAKLESQIAQVALCKGHLTDSAVRLRACLELRDDIQKRLGRMTVYATQKLAEDTGSPQSLAVVQRLSVLRNRVGEAESFLRPEIIRAGRERVERLIAQDDALRVYRFPLADALRNAPHTLDEGGEALVAKFGLMSRAGGSTYSILSNADLPWPTIALSTAEQVRLDQAGYTRYRESADRADRKKVMDAFFGAWKTYERTVGVTLYSQLKEAKVYAEVRKFPDSITRALDAENVPVAVYDTLVAQSNANLPTLHRYFRLRARMLGVERMAYYDVYPPLVHGSFRYALADAKRLAVESVAPLGRDYADALAKGLDSRWMDAYPRPRKEAGAHMAGIAYDVHPYVLMNYNGDYESVTTLAHEWGHAMHSHLANRAQPFATARYAIFVAEIASTFNEYLLLDAMLKRAKSDDERLFYLGSALEGLRATFFRQTMFAEFERDIHARVDRGEPLTGDALTKAYCDVLRRYHGSAQGVVDVDDLYCVEWAYIPHFYSSFYVYQYATSIAASSLFAQRVVAGDKDALERYLGLLRAGGSDYPYELVKAAGVDLATPAPYEALMRRMNAIMDEIETILAKRGK